MSDSDTAVRELIDVLNARRMRFLADDAPVIAEAVAKVEAAMPPLSKDQRAGGTS